MWIINGPVCYQNDKLDHTFHVDYALQWVFTFECPLKSEYLFISAQMHVLPSKQLLKLLGICEDGTCLAQSKHQPLCIRSWKYGQSSRRSYWPLCVHQDPHLSFTASIYLRFMRSNSSLLQTELISDACQLPFRSARVYVTFKYLNFASTSSWENYNHQPPRQQSQDPCSGKQVCFQRYLWPTVNFIYQASWCGSILYSWFGPIISGL